MVGMSALGWLLGFVVGVKLVGGAEEADVSVPLVDQLIINSESRERAIPLRMKRFRSAGWVQLMG